MRFGGMAFERFEDFLPMDVADEGFAWCRVTDLAQKVRKLRRAGKELFLPPPKVESTVFRLTRPRPVEDAVRVEARLRELFAHRRKKSAAAGGRRVEQLPPAELLALARAENQPG